jgi:hypothetical protein
MDFGEDMRRLQNEKHKKKHKKAAITHDGL